MVSFVIPALNAASTLDACIEGIFAARRGGTRIEVFLADNGSTDQTREIARRRGATVLSGPGLTVAGLRNLGAREARGELLAFVDADCVIAPDWIEKGLSSFSEPEVAAVGSPTNVPATGTWIERTWELHRHRANELKLVDWLPTVGLLVRASAFREVGGFNEALATCEDVDLGYRVAARYRIVSDPDVKSIHLGEPRTLWRFFTKELWRGKQNLTGLFSHGVKRSELPSLLLPAYQGVWNAILLAAIACGLTLGTWTPTFVAASMLLLPALLLAFNTSLKTRRLRSVPGLFILYLAYATARAAALVAGALPRAPASGVRVHGPDIRGDEDPVGGHLSAAELRE